MTAGHAPAERAALADEVFLADELREAPGSHPGGQWLSLGRGLEERFGSRATGTGSGDASRGHGPMVRGTRDVGDRRSTVAGSEKLQREEVRAVHEDFEDDEDRDQEAADDRDPPDVALDISIFVCRPD